MGDIIHALPAITALRAANPDLHIGWLVEERWAELLCARGSDRLADRSPAKPLVDSRTYRELQGVAPSFALR